jgi:hypothetical protein
MAKDENEINFSQEELKEMIAAKILREAKDCSIWVIQ